jgi:hypothetical protein
MNHTIVPTVVEGNNNSPKARLVYNHDCSIDTYLNFEFI